MNLPMAISICPAEYSGQPVAKIRSGEIARHTPYQQLLSEPTATLTRVIDECPHCAHVAVLGYN
ncbi:hypothetical protein VSR69_43280 [Paraburkholderia phytofirmans]